jgi:aminopeptidase N
VRLQWSAALIVLAAVGAGVVYWRTSAPDPVPEAGVSLELAGERAERIRDLRYAATFVVPAARSATVDGRIVMRFTLEDRSRPIVLDFAASPSALRAATANGQPFAAAIQNGHIVVPASALLAGENIIDVDFAAGDGPLNRQDDFLYSLFVPARASVAMPCFDQPSLKARWTISLDVPAGWAAISNTAEAERTPRGDRVLIRFAETLPLPTYLVAFAAGRFNEVQGERDGRTFRLWHRETDLGRLARNQEAIFDQHARALAWLEDYTGIPYPFPKFDAVLLPAFQFSGMEHPGAVYYNANTLLLDASASQQQALARANVIAHETAHMWFGNLVTMPWFDDVWMKEVFANFMAAKIVNPTFPSMNHDLRFLLQHLPAAYDVDRTAGANPIRQPLANLDEAGSLYGAIIYQKAPVVMRQLERLVGESTFRDGVRAYLAGHAHGNASWLDLVEALDPRTPADVRAWSRAWVEEAGRPTIRTELVIEDDRIRALTLHQQDPRERDLVWPQQLDLVIGRGTSVRGLSVSLGGPETTVPAAEGLPAPAWVLPDGRSAPYGFFDLDRGTLDHLADYLHAIPDALTRGTALVMLWECMLEGRLEPASVVRQLSAAIRRERDELNLQQMLDYLRVAFWRFTPADERAPLSAAIEQVLRDGLARAPSTSAKAAWFGALRAVATRPATLEWLERVWRREEAIPGLRLSEVDEADLAADLAVRDVPAAAAILETQLARLENPDRKARFAFIMPALSSDAAERERFFERLYDPAERTREAWVLDAMRYLHHPLRAAISRRLVRPALGLVQDIQRTGDIFFPKRWVDATLGGYQSVQTAAEVRAFIDSLPTDYPPRLRWVLLASADPLFRAADLQQ